MEENSINSVLLDVHQNAHTNIIKDYQNNSEINRDQKILIVEDPQLDSNDPVSFLIRIITAEKNAPNILPYQKELLEGNENDLEQQEGSLFGIVIGQEQALKELEQSIKNKQNNQENWDFQQQQHENMAINLYRADIERIKYLIKTYMRIRLQKIQRYYMSIVQEKDFKFLCQKEIKFVLEYNKSKTVYFEEKLIKSLPTFYRDLGNEKTKKNKMDKIEAIEPNLQKYVFCKFIRNPGQYVDINGQNQQFKEDDVILAQYSEIKLLFEKSFVELI